MAAEKLEQGTIYSRSGFWLLGSHPLQRSHGWITPALLAVRESSDGVFPVSQTQSIRSRQKCVNSQYSGYGVAHHGSGESPRVVMTDGFLQMYDRAAACDYCTVQFTVFE
jgi:hypothetical protein